MKPPAARNKMLLNKTKQVVLVKSQRQARNPAQLEKLNQVVNLFGDVSSLREVQKSSRAGVWRQNCHTLEPIIR